MVLASDMDGATTIIKLAYEIYSVIGTGDGEFNDFEVLLCHTSLDSLTDTFDDNYDGNTPTSVISVDPLTVPNAEGVWYELPALSFAYNGTDNLIIETRWSSSNDISFDCYCGHGTGNRNLQAGEIDAVIGMESDHIVRKKLTVE